MIQAAINANKTSVALALVGEMLVSACYLSVNTNSVWCVLLCLGACMCTAAYSSVFVCVCRSIKYLNYIMYTIISLDRTGLFEATQ